MHVGEPITAEIDVERRKKIARHHTATHLLHWALQQVLGEHIKQAGSLVEPDRLRFDFNHHKPLSPEEIRRIEEMVNEKIRENTPVKAYELTYEEAQKHPDIKQFFGEKYGPKVRVIDIDFSKELCGGTHVEQAGTIGFVKVFKEGSIAAGVRRIEALAGKAAEDFVRHNEELSVKASALLKANLVQLPEKISALLEENKNLEAQLKTFKKNSLKSFAADLAKEKKAIASIPFLCKVVEMEQEDLMALSDLLLAEIPSLVLILAVKKQDRCHLFVKVSPDIVQKGIKANELIKEIAPLVEGTGGGKPDAAQAGGKNPEGIAAAFEKAKTLIQNKCH
jgi:alanyl-tRNA synthetase